MNGWMDGWKSRSKRDRKKYAQNNKKEKKHWHRK
jgi:hypothetical protein